MVKFYGAPAVIESLVMYYNKDLIKEAPKTFGELEELAKDSKYDFAGEAGKTLPSLLTGQTSTMHMDFFQVTVDMSR